MSKICHRVINKALPEVNVSIMKVDNIGYITLNTGVWVRKSEISSEDLRCLLKLRMKFWPLIF